MGWHVHAHHFIVSRAACLDCSPHWYGPVRMTEERTARDVERHRAWHVAEWARLNEEWDANWDKTVMGQLAKEQSGE